jgi:uncharacterized protein (DUF433 family)
METKMLSRIVVSPDICHGKARIKGTRVPIHNILRAYPQIAKDDIHECLLYAAILASEEIAPIEVEAA